MTRNFSEQTESDFVKLGIYQIAGGVVALLITLWSVYGSAFFSAPVAIIYFFVLAMVGFSILCGIKCLNCHKNALNYSLANQLLQTVYCSVAGFSFKYIAGVYLSVEIDLTSDVHLGLGLGIPDIELMINSGTEEAKAGINLVAIVLIYRIDKLAKKAREENELKIVRQIGGDVEP